MMNLRDNYYALQVADGEHAVIAANTITWRTPNATGRGFIALPPGTWEIVCTSKEATEDECALIAGLLFQDVVHGYSRTFFHDLLTSKGCNTKQNYLILKKVA
jgi:hypothetical protein